jgi:hypothetical protein
VDRACVFAVSGYPTSSAGELRDALFDRWTGVCRPLHFPHRIRDKFAFVGEDHAAGEGFGGGFDAGVSGLDKARHSGARD